MRSLGVGADSGEHAAWAVVEWTRGAFVLLHVADVYGVEHAWLRRARTGATSSWSHILDAVDQRLELAAGAQVWIEEPPAFSRQIGKGRRRTQASWIGLGRRVGLLEGLWWVESGEVSHAELVEPSRWWDELHGAVRRGKDERDGGLHRVREAEQLVRGSAGPLARIPISRRIDVAESILIAAAAAKSGRSS